MGGCYSRDDAQDRRDGRSLLSGRRRQRASSFPYLPKYDSSGSSEYGSLSLSSSSSSSSSDHPDGDGRTASTTATAGIPFEAAGVPSRTPMLSAMSD